MTPSVARWVLSSGAGGFLKGERHGCCRGSWQGRTSTTVEAMKSVPLALALLLVNVGFLGFATNAVERHGCVQLTLRPAAGARGVGRASIRYLNTYCQRESGRPR